MERQKWEGLDNDGNLLHDEPDRSMQPQIDDLQAQLEAVRRERDHAKKTEAIQKEVADNQTWHVQQLRQAIEHIHKAWAAKTPHEFHVWFAQHVALARATLEAAPTSDEVYHELNKWSREQAAKGGGGE